MAEVQERFVRHFETTNGGKSILVRMPKMWTGRLQFSPQTGILRTLSTKRCKTAI